MQTNTNQKEQTQKSPKQIPYQYGKVAFFSQFTRKTLEKIIDNQSFSFLQSNSIKILTDNGLEVNEIIKLISQWSIDNLAIHAHKFYREALIEISRIKFHKMCGLYLMGVNLYNVQFLTFIDAPMLEDIYFSDNNMTNCQKALNKLVFPKLKRLLIYKNDIQEFGICRLYFPKGGIEFYTINRSDDFLVHDIACLAKNQISPSSYLINILYLYQQFQKQNPFISFLNSHNHFVLNRTRILQPKIANSLLAKLYRYEPLTKLDRYQSLAKLYRYQPK